MTESKLVEKKAEYIEAVDLFLKLGAQRAWLKRLHAEAESNPNRDHEIEIEICIPDRPENNTGKLLQPDQSFMFLKLPCWKLGDLAEVLAGFIEGREVIQMEKIRLLRVEIEKEEENERK